MNFLQQRQGTDLQGSTVMPEKPVLDRENARMAQKERAWQESSQGKALRKKRSELPIAAIRSSMLEALAMSEVIIVCGDTGCGKTTQVGVIWGVPWVVDVSIGSE